MKSRVSVGELFYGVSTVGERGQVVVPVQARKNIGIEPGDRLLVFGHPFSDCLILAKAESLETMLNELVSSLGIVREAVSEETKDEG